MSFKPIDDRQVVNREALSNIGSPANDTLDDVFSRLNALLGTLTSNNTYIAKVVNLSSGTTSLVVTIPARPDTSYVVMGMMQNSLDFSPQYQQVEVTNKTTTGFTFKWNAPLGSSNYYLNYIVPPTYTNGTETSLASGISTTTVTLNVPENGSNYGIVSVIQDTVDMYPQFQSPLITTQGGSSFINATNAPTSSPDYQLVWINNPTAQISIGNSANSVTASLPVSYGNANYAIVASLSNVTDSSPKKFQPIIATIKGDSQTIFQWNTSMPTGNYLLTYYAISVTP